MTNVRDHPDTTTFATYLDARRQASDDYVNGDVEPLLRLSTHVSPATIYPPNGLVVRGADDVDAFNQGGATLFEPGSENSIEIIHADSSGDLAYLVGIQHSVVRMRGRDEPVPMQLRLTEVFRREDGAWKLIHRHADPVGDPS